MTGPDLVSCNVVVDIDDAIRTARDHFQTLGLANLALFHCGAQLTAAGRFNAFHELVPGGHFFHQILDVKGVSKIAAARKAVGEWLLELPKPVGILALENTGALRLSEICQQLGLSIPEEVQLIGVGDLDECLMSQPHLTSLELPSERIGEIALATVLRHLSGREPEMSEVIRVDGAKLIARGSTRATSVGAAKVTAAMSMIQTRATKGMSAAGMVRQLKIGHTSFYKHFRGLTGTTPAQHLRATRLKEACRMLAETNASITKIASTCGFSSPEYFARSFRRETGQTPSAWRQSREGMSGQ